MPQNPTSKRRYLHLLGAMSPAFIAVLASLWPLEQAAFVLLSGLLAFAAIIIVIGVRSPPIRSAGLASLLVVVSVAVSNWPLRTAYAFSRPSFDRIADQVRGGDLPTGPCLIGAFLIDHVEVRDDGIVCLWTDDDPSGKTGFVQTETADQNFNLWSQITLDESWQFISED